MKSKNFTLTVFIFFLLVLPWKAFSQGELVVLETDAPLNEIILADTAADGSQLHSVYKLKRDGYYVLSGLISSDGFDLNIIGEEGAGALPVLIMGSDIEGNRISWALMSGDQDFTLKNLQIINATDNGNRGWNAGILPNGQDATITVDNCILDFNDGTFIDNEGGFTDQTHIFTNNLFRYNGVVPWGGPWTGFGVIIKNTHTNMLYFENNTMVDCIAPFLVFENGNLQNFWFNHNTVVDHAQFLFRSEYWINCLVMNNLFVNAHFAGEPAARRDGQDPDALPYGVMTVASPDTAWDGFPAENERVLLLAHNDNFVSQEIKDWWAQAAIDFDTVDYQVADYAKGDNGFLNSRADSMIREDNTNHPKFLWDDQYSIRTENPNFPNYTSDFTEMIKWSRTAWGQQGLGELNWAKHPENDPKIPMAADLLTFEYDNSTLQTAAYQGYPVGDLNWFPTQKAAWDADPDKETYESILAMINNGTWSFTTSIEDNKVFPTSSGVQLDQNYPNPFRSSTRISFTIPESGQVTIKVINLLGQQVGELINKHLGAGTHEVIFNADEFPSGTLFYQMEYSGTRLTRQLFIMK